jgi:hypothetical protein
MLRGGCNKPTVREGGDLNFIENRSPVCSVNTEVSGIEDLTAVVMPRYNAV